MVENVQDMTIALFIHIGIVRKYTNVSRTKSKLPQIIPKTFGVGKSKKLSFPHFGKHKNQLVQ